MAAQLYARRALVGLGNPGAEFARTRHNAGRIVLDFIADEVLGRLPASVCAPLEPASLQIRAGRTTLAHASAYRLTYNQALASDWIDMHSARRRARTQAEGVAHGVVDIALVRPNTFMNLSGKATAQLARDWPHDEMLVLYDDVHLPLGLVRLKTAGSGGSHNGIRSIVDRMGSSAFPRLRIGIGLPEGAGPGAGSMAAYVLGKFGADELATLRLAAAFAGEVVRVYVHRGLQEAAAMANNMTAMEWRDSRAA